MPALRQRHPPAPPSILHRLTVFAVLYACLFACVSISASRVPLPPRPDIPLQFTAVVNNTHHSHNRSVTVLYYDAVYERMATPPPALTGFYADAHGLFFVHGDSCRRIAHIDTFFNLFEWTQSPGLHYDGPGVVILNTPRPTPSSPSPSLPSSLSMSSSPSLTRVRTHRWSLTVPNKGLFVIDVDARDHRVPVRLLYPSFWPRMTSMVFNTFQPRPFPAPSSAPSVFTLPPLCAPSMQPPPLCAGVKSVPTARQRRRRHRNPFMTTKTVYIAHPHKYYNVTDQDVADALGDVAFNCPDVLRNGTGVLGNDGYDVVSMYEIEMDTRWGQYQLCNFYPVPSCVGMETHAVGREYSHGYGHDHLGGRAHPLQGQCTPDTALGVWYSLPAGGQCLDDNTDHYDDDDVRNDGDDGGACTWRVLRLLKTVDISCLKSHEFRRACVTDTRAHDTRYTHALRVFERAFASASKSRGGCVDVRSDRV